MRTVLLNAIVKEIKRGQLLDLVNTTGGVLLSGLKKLEVYHYSKLLVQCTILMLPVQGVELNIVVVGCIYIILKTG